MSLTPERVFLLEHPSGDLVPAELYDVILPRHLEQVEFHWQSQLAAQDAEHGHWNWRLKMDDCGDLLSHQSFALECGGMTQGLMIVNTTRRCRLRSQANKHLVYVEYLQSAPWNQIAQEQRYRGIGTVLLMAAIRLSQSEGNHGRIGLHSLPQADEFYRHCGMTDLAPDFDEYPTFPLRYFEMTEAQAAAFLKGRES